MAGTWKWSHGYIKLWKWDWEVESAVEPISQAVTCDREENDQTSTLLSDDR